ncbi:uncharacterized protein RCC_00742 [Ramularia collo-cygni]|uniref:Beta-lactamase-related domain-containing protein n=1 Tax=Ramularia collo-cygni TaxID=112498 RepID=A0A2D3UM47_9PEZI|nr:uncharacterized protein RCC_00742 [Ramularia collo-cygni]CZT14791.1 uncharacterized protein RCC_00742 [Ramularia collo-cygni]
MSTAEADLSSWLKFPHNQWAFANIDKVLPTATISKSSKPGNFPQAPNEFSEFEIESNGIKHNLSSYLSQSQTDGLIILQHGKVLLENYFNGNTKDSKHIVMSITKSVTGLLVGILQARGKLSVDDLVSKYVPEISGTVWRDKTIQQCIDMRSGVAYVDGTHEYRAAAGWHPLNGSEQHTDLKTFLSNFVPQEVIDDRFEYVSANTDLIGWVLERASGKSFAELMQELLWQPMGAENDAVVALDPKAFARAAGGLCPTLRDLARLVKLFVDDGKNTEGDVVVPVEWIQDIMHGGSKEAWQRGKFAAMFGNTFDMVYRSFCYVDKASDIVMGFGVYGQVFFADKKQGLVFVTTSSQDSPVDVDKIRMTLAAFKEFKRVLMQT